MEVRCVEIPFSFWDKFNIEMKKINPSWVVGEIWGDAKWLEKIILTE